VFQIWGPAAVKAKLLTVESLKGGTTKRQVPQERNKSAGQIVTEMTGANCNSALRCKTLYGQYNNLIRSAL